MFRLKTVYDAITKSKLLSKMYVDVSNMNQECERIFSKSFDCLMNMDKKTALLLGKEDKKINRYEIKIRNDILHYLVVSAAPNLGAALSLTNIVVCYERIGDYCKVMAHAAILYPTHLENDEYAYIVRQMKSTILKMFHLTHDAIKHYNQKDAKLVVKTYAGIKTLHDSLTHKINKDKNIEPNKAIVYALLTIYLRRIGAHLKNICTTILKPFPEIGFEKTYH